MFCGQEVQLDAAEVEYVPTEQAVHAVEPEMVVYVPAGQDTHALMLLAFVALLYLPGGQGICWSLPGQ